MTHADRDPAPTEQREAVKRRLGTLLDQLDEQTRRPGEPRLRDAVAAQARDNLAEMDEPR